MDQCERMTSVYYSLEITYVVLYLYDDDFVDKIQQETVRKVTFTY